MGNEIAKAIRTIQVWQTDATGLQLLAKDTTEASFFEGQRLAYGECLILLEELPLSLTNDFRLWGLW